MASSLNKLFWQALETLVINAIVACSVILTLAAVYCLVKLPDSRRKRER